MNKQKQNHVLICSTIFMPPPLNNRGCIDLQLLVRHSVVSAQYLENPKSFA